jgi:hypothetical protein
MSSWSKDELRKMAEADDLHIPPFREGKYKRVTRKPVHHSTVNNRHIVLCPSKEKFKNPWVPGLD